MVEEWVHLSDQVVSVRVPVGLCKDLLVFVRLVPNKVAMLSELV